MKNALINSIILLYFLLAISLLKAFSQDNNDFLKNYNAYSFNNSNEKISKIGCGFGINMRRYWYSGKITSQINNHNAYSLFFNLFAYKILVEFDGSFAYERLDQINFNGDILKGAFYSDFQYLKISAGYVAYENPIISVVQITGYT